MRIYITHCSGNKDDSLKNTDKKVTPDKMYLSDRIQGFMNMCKENNVNWAIFSDLYGVWFPHIKHKWYNKDPYTVTEEEFKALLQDFDTKLEKFDEIWFYRNPIFFHNVYRRLVGESSLKHKIKLFSSKYEIL